MAAAPITQSPPRWWQFQAVGWYLAYFSSQVTVAPFLGAWFARQGLTAQQLGLINAFRPWLGLPASFTWGIIADHFKAHRIVMLGTFVGSVVVRSLLLLVHSFGAIMAMVIATQVFASPVGVLADAAVVGACRDGEYGSYRKWGAVGWGIMSFVSGALINSYGMLAAIILHGALSLPCLFLGWGLHSYQAKPQSLTLPGKQPGKKKPKMKRKESEDVELTPEQKLMLTMELDYEDENWMDLEHGSISIAHKRPHVKGPHGNAPNGPSTVTIGPDLATCQISEVSEHDAAPKSLNAVVELLSRNQPSVELARTKALSSNNLVEQEQQALDQEKQGRVHSTQSTPSRPAHRVMHIPMRNVDSAVELSRFASPTSSTKTKKGKKTRKKTDGTTSKAVKNAQLETDGIGNGNADTNVQKQDGNGTENNGQNMVALQIEEDPDSRKKSSSNKLYNLFTDPQVLVFLTLANLMGFGFGIIETFLFVFLQDLGATELLMGLTLTITCAAEVPVFEAQEWLLRKLSVNRLLDVVVITYMLRMLAYASLPSWGSAWAVLPVEVLHGITFGLGWGVGTINCKRIAPTGLSATMQGLFQGSWFGSGYGLGALVGGLISQRIGYSQMYLCGASIMFGGWLIVLLLRRFIPEGRSSGYTAVPVQDH